MDQIKRDRPTMAAYRYEKELKKIATRGVVALFNAVSEAQKPAEDETAIVAKDMDKSDFLTMLQKKTTPTAASSSSSSGSGSSNAPAESSTPSYLRDDYMTGASMKHWDQEDDEESDNGEMNNGNGPEESDSDDSDSD